MDAYRRFVLASLSSRHDLLVLGHSRVRTCHARVARAIANAAPAAAANTRLIMAAGYRDGYLRALKALSRDANPGPYMQMLDRAHRFTAELPFGDHDHTADLLERTGALDDSGDRRLRLPSELHDGGRRPAWPPATDVRHPPG